MWRRVPGKFGIDSYDIDQVMADDAATRREVEALVSHWLAQGVDRVRVERQIPGALDITHGWFILVDVWERHYAGHTWLDFVTLPVDWR